MCDVLEKYMKKTTRKEKKQSTTKKNRSSSRDQTCHSTYSDIILNILFHFEKITNNFFILSTI